MLKIEELSELRAHKVDAWNGMGDHGNHFAQQFSIAVKYDWLMSLTVIIVDLSTHKYVPA